MNVSFDYMVYHDGYNLIPSLQLQFIKNFDPEFFYISIHFYFLDFRLSAFIANDGNQS